MKLLWMLAALYMTYGLAMVWLHPQFIYPFGPDPFDARGWQQEVIGDRQVAMALSAGSEDVATLFFMGNGGALAYFTYTLDAHVAAGRTVAAMEYPGGGGIPGKPSERRLKADALVAYDWLRDRHDGPIVVHGYSMGSGLALHVAAEREVAAIVLDAPFVKMCELMTRASWLPACWMPGVQKWNSARLVPRLSASVLVQHGTADQLIPMSVGQRLVGLMQRAGLDVTFHAVEGATHNNLAGQAGYQDRIDTFLSRAMK
ncbi:alpha/beta hydrolase [Yoonia sp. 2307UL14-13]|uniref:alpha/beta hydrolase n=1 Tax=Yoonia sp. 2307UL14-13 TaxID=3126506 RepID=UPI0030AC084D